MALVVETGTGGDALISLAQFNDFAEKMGWDVSAYDDLDIEAAIRRASYYISTNYKYQGYTIGGRAQVLAFPRSGMIDGEGHGIDPTTVPREAETATYHATYYEMQTPGGLTPSGSTSDLVKSESVGPISIEYAGAGNGVDGLRPTLFAVKDALGPLLSKTSFSPFTARADRG